MLKLKTLLQGTTLALSIGLGACATSSDVIGGGAAPKDAPAPVASAAQVQQHQSTYGWHVVIYPGAGATFNPHPKLTVEEYNILRQHDWYCAVETDKVRGQIMYDLKNGVKMGFFEGIMNAFGMKLGFGAAVSGGGYLVATGLTALGGGIAASDQTFEMQLNAFHGYCMTGMTYKADELEGLQKRLSVAPDPVGSNKLPDVSDDPAPTFTGGTGVPQQPNH